MLRGKSSACSARSVRFARSARSGETIARLFRAMHGALGPNGSHGHRMGRRRVLYEFEIRISISAFEPCSAGTLRRYGDLFGSRARARTHTRTDGRAVVGSGCTHVWSIFRFTSIHVDLYVAWEGSIGSGGGVWTTVVEAPPLRAASIPLRRSIHTYTRSQACIELRRTIHSTLLIRGDVE